MPDPKPFAAMPNGGRTEREGQNCPAQPRIDCFPLWFRVDHPIPAIERRQPSVAACMTEPSCTRHLPASGAAATVAATFDSP